MQSVPPNPSLPPKAAMGQDWQTFGSGPRLNRSDASSLSTNEDRWTPGLGLLLGARMLGEEGSRAEVTWLCPWLPPAEEW